jgi:uncharacterized membrane protein YkoI
VNLKTKLIIGTLVVSGILGTSACSGTNNQPKTAQTNKTSQTISEAKATEIALNTLKGGIVTSSHVDKNEKANKYEISILKEDKNYEVDVDSSSGEILEINQSVQGERKMNDVESIPPDISPKISTEEARQIALNRVRGTITELDLENFNNRLVYDIEISTVYHREAKVIVDAMTGKILQFEEM